MSLLASNIKFRLISLKYKVASKAVAQGGPDLLHFQLSNHHMKSAMEKFVLVNLLVRLISRIKSKNFKDRIKNGKVMLR